MEGKLEKKTSAIDIGGAFQVKINHILFALSDNDPQ